MCGKGQHKCCGNSEAAIGRGGKLYKKLAFKLSFEGLVGLWQLEILAGKSSLLQAQHGLKVGTAFVCRNIHVPVGLECGAPGTRLSLYREDGEVRLHL